MHTTLCALVILCAQSCLACYLDSIDTVVSDLIHFGQDIGQCMQNHSLSAWVTICAQAGLACSDSIDTLISLIQPNLAEIWA